MFCFCKMVFKCYLPNKLPQNDHFCVCVCVCVCVHTGRGEAVKSRFMGLFHN